MPPTLVNAAVGALLAAALLGAAYDRRAVVVVVGAAALPDLDAAVSLLIQGATNAVLHNVWIPALAVALLYWDTEYREASWLRDRWGWYGVRVAWVAVATYAVAGIGLDFFDAEAVNLFYPVHDRFYAVVGYLFVSTQEGIVQTYVGFGNGTLGPFVLDSPGTTADHHVSSWINPDPDADNPGLAGGRLHLVESGWQAVVVASAVAVTAIRFWEDAEAEPEATEGEH